jgi:hypothetical protein
MPIVEIDAHLRRQGYDPSTGLPVGITQQDFDARNSQYREIAALHQAETLQNAALSAAAAVLHPR